MVNTFESSSASSSRSSSSEGASFGSSSFSSVVRSSDHAERPNETTSEETSTSGVAEVQGKLKRVSNRQRYGPSEVPGYEWVNREVTSYYSRYQDTSMITNLLDYTNCLTFNAKENPYPIGIRSCRNNAFPNPDTVCLDQSGAKMESFYIYDCLLRDLKVKLPFDEFTMGVLRVLNVAPTQLHPNSWAQLQGFKHLCRCIHIRPSPLLFLYFYSSRPSILAKWLSLSRVGERQLLDSFTSSYKNFKAGFFRVTIRPNGRRFFFGEDNRSLFPLYWTRAPRPYDVVPKSLLSAEERKDLKLLLRLPRRLPTRSLINLVESPLWENDLIGIMVSSGADELNIHNLLAVRVKQVKQVGGVGTSNVARTPQREQDNRELPSPERKKKKGRKGKEVDRCPRHHPIGP
ncbi:uncharacterized protein LOC114916316 [Cajanus cajan]|uniref:uncharacterized protein LOC114916316 n=1 Tax=Cajanus cajan TaxID=3821 RepID=UPI0010FBA560|nr:uncharacterized protein LOC114916316 [Cajanus cajan]